MIAYGHLYVIGEKFIPLFLQYKGQKFCLVNISMYLRATIICGYKFWWISEIVCLVGTHFSHFSKLTFYLFENVEKFNIRGYNF